MNDITSEVMPATLLKSLVNRLRLLLAQGREPSYSNLKQACPGHSDRDYAAATRKFRQEREQAIRFKDSLPQEASEYGRLLVELVWARAKEHFSEQLTETIRMHNLAINESRAARDKSENDKCDLASQLEDLQKENRELREKLTEADTELHKLRKEKEETDASNRIMARQLENEREIGIWREQMSKQVETFINKAEDSLKKFKSPGR